MKLHELKIKHEYLTSILNGEKTFELRKNDRDYQVGDLISFIDIGDDGEDKERYCFIDILYKITYILKNVEEYGLNKDYCILGIRKVKLDEE